MPNKRSRRKDKQKFFCPHCQRNLWRVGSPKYFLFYLGKSEIQRGLNLTHKKASLLSSQQPAYIDLNIWLEEFFCEEDGKVWMYLSKLEDEKLSVRPATPEDWNRTTKTPDPERPHCSASEFTYRMSRRCQPDLVQRFYE